MAARKRMFVVVVTPDVDRERVLSVLDLDEEQVTFLPHADATAERCKELDPGAYVFYRCDPIDGVTCPIVVKDENDAEGIARVEDIALMDFPHLHLHDEFSLRDGVGTVKQRSELMQERRQTYLTATNHGSLGGWVKQYVTAKKLGFKPVFAIEAYVNQNRHFNREEVKTFDEQTKAMYRHNSHMLLMAKTLQGWFNIIKVHNDAYENGFYYVPRTDDEFMLKHAGGVIATSCDGGAGEIPKLLCDETIPHEERFERARTKYERYKEAFDDYYIELNLLDWDYQRQVNRLLIQFGEWVGAKYVITCDCHYLRKEDSATHDVLLMLRDSKTVVDKAFGIAARFFKEKTAQLGLTAEQVKEDKARYDALVAEALASGRAYLETNGYKEAITEFGTRTKDLTASEELGSEDAVWEFSVKDLYFKDFPEIYSTWQKLHGGDDVFTEEIFWKAARNTRQLVRSVENFDVDTSVKLPRLTNDPGAELRRLCDEGMRKRGLSGNEEYEKRLREEITVIDGMGFSDYFLIFRKIVELCQNEKISLGAGRGSASGSLAAYCLEITQVDPLKFGLLFERFLEEGRAPVFACSFKV